MLCKKYGIVSILLITFLLVGVGCYFIIVPQNNDNGSDIDRKDENLTLKNDILDLVVLNTTSALCLDGSPGS